MKFQFRRDGEVLVAVCEAPMAWRAVGKIVKERHRKPTRPTSSVRHVAVTLAGERLHSNSLTIGFESRQRAAEVLARAAGINEGVDNLNA